MILDRSSDATKEKTFALRLCRPIVRRRLCLAVIDTSTSAAPLVRASPYRRSENKIAEERRKARTKGLARIEVPSHGEAEPSPHIGRQSRIQKLLKK
jgi:hypothetical protein